MTYTEGFKARMIQRMTGPEALSAWALSREVGAAESTLSRWLRHRRLDPVTSDQDDKKVWTPADKLRAVQESATLSDDELGEFLRREGLHKVQLDEWSKLALASLQPQKRKTRGKSPEAKRIRQLEKEIHRKDKALAEVTALLALQKKLDALWGDAGGGTDTKSET